MSKALLPEDVQRVASHLSRPVAKLVIKHGLMVAGGFVRERVAGKSINDVDLFGSEEAVKAARMDIPGAPIVTDNACTYLKLGPLPVQLITRWKFDNPGDLLAAFDFTICSAVVWHDASLGWMGDCHDRFYADLAARRLHYTNPADPEAGASLLRMAKFLRRGYRIAPEQLAAVVAAATSQATPRFEDFEAETVVDPTSGLRERLTKNMREVDPLTRLTGGGDQ